LKYAGTVITAFLTGDSRNASASSRICDRIIEDISSATK